MELKEFISETIKQIADGVIEGSNYAKREHGGEGVRSGYKNVQFDIAITSSDEDKSGVGGKISVAQVFNVGANKENVQKVTNHNRVQFSTNIDIIS